MFDEPIITVIKVKIEENEDVDSSITVEKCPAIEITVVINITNRYKNDIIIIW